MKKNVLEIQRAVRSAGGSSQDAYTLAGVSYCLTLGDPAWSSGDGRGAWGVSQKWHPGTPSDLNGQAKQALGIYKSRGLVGMAENIALTAIAWWYPTGDAPTEFKARMETRAKEYKLKARSKFNFAGVGLGWILIAGVAVWYFFGRKG